MQPTEVDYNTNDREVYEQELMGFLPPRIFDAHVHLFDRSCLTPEADSTDQECYDRFGGFFTLNQYRKWTDRLLPDQECHMNSFGHPSCKLDLDAAAAYTGQISDNERSFGMALVSPHDDVEQIRKRIDNHKLVGYKPYLRFVDWKEASDVTIHDMLADDQMELADERGLAITLHIPRSGRLADPVNQSQMVELCERYPDANIIFAHIGRAYFGRNVIDSLDGIAGCPNAYVDTAMVNHAGVLEYTFDHFPRERILFGSDAPIAFLRGKAVEINNQYAYLMGEDYHIGTSIYDPGSGVQFTSFFYEQLRGIKLAAERAGLTAEEVSNIFFDNAQQLFSQVARSAHGRE